MRRFRFAVLLAVLAAVLPGATGRGARAAGGPLVIEVTLTSSLLGRDLHEIVVVPAGDGRGRELLVFLHGRSSSAHDQLTPQLLAALDAEGRRAPVVLLGDGGDASYWHDRRDGPWATSLLRESIPEALRLSHADGSRIAIGGISMGGFGALDLARLHPDRFCAVGAHSPALWQSGGETAAGAFDDAADFARHDLIRLAAARRLYRVPVWIDVGTEDPFLAADRLLATELKAHGTDVRFQTHPGGHDGWADRMAEYIRFYARTRSCR